MKVLVADDDPVSRGILEKLVARWGYEPVMASDGRQARAVLGAAHAAQLAIIDWMMPGMNGLEVCRSVRKEFGSGLPYVIMLTAMGRREDIVAGLDAGANDYVTKPFDHEELKARLGVGVRVAELQGLLAERVRDLEEALASVKQLSGLLPICSYCKKVRDDRNYWQQVESYVGQHSEAQFSHSICPDCYEEKVKPMLRKARPRS
ncbi:MAG: response regulator transcription factor [Chloroflexi bacterium]|nr:MAG: response regulator transcription factor [Chloroflexota bacterium]